LGAFFVGREIDEEVQSYRGADRETFELVSGGTGVWQFVVPGREKLD
jgi:hypothetical protein